MNEVEVIADILRDELLEDKLHELMEDYGIEFIGGCPHCQPNGDWADGWGTLPDEIWEVLVMLGESCCSDEGGPNFPVFCKFEEVGE